MMWDEQSRLLSAQAECYVGFTNRELKLLSPSVLSSNPADYIDKYSNFTSQNKGVAYLLSCCC